MIKEGKEGIHAPETGTTESNVRGAGAELIKVAGEPPFPILKKGIFPPPNFFTVFSCSRGFLNSRSR